MNTQTKKPDADFIIRLIGPGVRPWVVPLRNLSSLFDAVQRVFEGEQDIDEQEQKDIEKVQLRLLDVRVSSAAYKVAASHSEHALNRLKVFGKSLEKPDVVNWETSELSSIHDLSGIAKSLGCRIEFRYPGKQRAKFGNVIAKIEPDTYRQIAGTAFISGHTSIYARIERVGGATKQHCGIRIQTQPRKMVVCRVQNEELVRQLGKHIYQEVVLNGMATWLKHNGHLKSMSITSFEEPKKGSICDALERIYQAGGKAWDNIENPDAILMEMRK